MFQSTRPRGARLTTDLRIIDVEVFQSTRPRGARLQALGFPWPTSCRFNPRAREGRDPSPCSGASRKDRRFNPRAREGRDRKQIAVFKMVVRVSIHAPARGATRIARRPCIRRTRFNPRAREGRDTALPDHVPDEALFQSTRPRGARHATAGAKKPWRVSIHAPARGATSFRMRRASGDRGFNPRAREGRDSTRARCTRSSASFQSTRPRGARPDRVAEFCRVVGFQSTRPRGARRRIDDRGVQSRVVSIHAPARGATSITDAVPFPAGVSIHAPARGATFCASSKNTRGIRFNPRAREGRDPISADWPATAAPVSIHAPARGATRQCPHFGLCPSGFNPRAREGRDRPTHWMPLPEPPFQSTRPRGARRGCGRKIVDRGRFQSTRPRGARRTTYRAGNTLQTFQSTRPRGARRRHGNTKQGKRNISGFREPR